MNVCISIFRVNLNFGIFACVGGILGVVIGTGTAQYWRKTNPRADPLVCAIGVFGCVPFAFIGLVIADKISFISWFFIFIAITFLSLNCALVADMLMYVIVPHRRSLAQAMAILFAHLFGDAISPFIVGAVSTLNINFHNFTVFLN